MKVLCPFCTFKEISYNRPGDLKAHSLRKHMKEIDRVGVSADSLFSENNCFWMAYHPADYRAFVEPTSSTSRAATRTQQLIIEWFRATTCRPRRNVAAWQSGWEERAVRLPEVKDPPYSPETPKVPQLVTKSVCLTPGDVTAWFQEDTRYYLVKIEDSILLDARAISSLTRKMAFLTKEETPVDGYSDLAGSQLSTIRKRAAATLAIDEKFIGNIQKREELVTASGDAPEAGDETEMEPELDLHARSEIDPGSPAKSVTSATPDYEPRQASRSPSPVRKKPRKETEVVPSADSHSTAASSKVPSYVVVANMSTSKNNKGSRTEADPQVASTSKSHKGSMKERAENILARGCMPMLPPARRNWKEEEVVTLSVGQVSVKWPPKGFKTMTKDQKLLEAEFAAMMFVKSKGRSDPLHRGELLDTFNFLILPGTVPLSPKKVSPPLFKSRVYLYQAVRNIALNDGTPNKEDADLIELLEASMCKRHTTWDRLLGQIDSADVALRLSEED